MAEDVQSEDTMMQIPELPQGSTLSIRLLSNWGDPVMIGLQSIEIFTNLGTRAPIEKIYSNTIHSVGDVECIVSKGSRNRRWSANMIEHNKELKNDPICITIVMTQQCQIAMIRFWNYNQSRVHAQIGVRHVELYLDERIIFGGEIDCAFSADAEFEPQMGDTILFTTDDSILEAIAENDKCLSTERPVIPNICEHLTPYRPTTCETKEVHTPVEIILTPPSFPATTAGNSRNDVKLIHIELISNWGMRGLIGLTGIEIIDDSNQVVPEEMITSATVSEGDSSTLCRLFNGRNLTRNADEMWLTNFNEKLTISLTFIKPITVKAISFWNYNSSFEMSYCGVKDSKIYINGKLVVPHVILRKATGFVYFDFVQDVSLDSASSLIPFRPSSKNYIGGFVFQLRLLSTWGDEFYIGLNGIELYNMNGELIKIKSHHLAAFPESVNILPAIKNDLRVSSNLINGINDTDEARFMWLTALLPNRCARVFFVFDTPTYISKLIVYNYRKTPERGVRHISVTIDDLIVFSGEVPASTMDVTAKLEINLQNL